MIQEILKLSPESVGYIYGLSYFFIGTTSFFLLTRRNSPKRLMMFWLFLWGVFYGLHELFDVFADIKSNDFYESLSTYTKFFAYYFLANIFIYGLKDFWKDSKKKTKILISSLTVFLILLLLQIFLPSLLFVVPTFASLLVSFYFIKVGKDKTQSRQLRKFALVISSLFVLFSFFTVFESLHLYGDSQTWAYYVKLIRAVIGLFISLFLLYYFLEALTPFYKPKYYRVARRFIIVAFVIFIVSFFISNKSIVSLKSQYSADLASHKKDSLEHIVALYNKATEEIFSLNKALSHSDQVQEFIDVYYKKEEENDQSSQKELLLSALKNEIYHILDEIIPDDKSRIIYIMDRNGDVLLSSNRGTRDSFENNNYSFRPYFKEALAGADSVYYAKGVTSGKKGGYYASPIIRHNREGGIFGVIVVKISEEELFDFMESESGSFILDERGYVFASGLKEIEDKQLFGDNFEQGKQPEEFSGFKKIEQNIFLNRLGDTYFFRTMGVKPAGWKIGLFEPYKHISSILLDKIYEILMLIAFYMLVFYVVLAYLIDTLILQITENRYKDIYQNSSDLIFSFNSSGGINFVNPACLRTLAYSDVDILNTGIDKLIDPAYKQKFRKALQSVLDKGKKENLELRFVGQNGQKIWVLGSLERELRDNNFYVVRGIFKNNTQIKEREIEIKKKNEELEKLLKEEEVQKERQEKQRLATLNILEDVTETQATLEKYNKDLKIKTAEMESLSKLSSEFANAFSLDNLLKKVNNYFWKNVDFDSISFFIDAENLEEKSIYKTYLKSKVGANYIAEVKEMAGKYLLKNAKKYSLKASVLEKMENKLIGKTSPGGAKKVSSHIIYSLAISEKDFGFICLTSSKKNIYKENDLSYLKTVISNFSVALSNINLLEKSQKSKTESLVRAISNGIVMFDLNKNINLINSAAEKFLGIKSDGGGLDFFYQQTAEHKIEQKLEQALSDGEASVVEELVFSKNKREKTYKITIVPVSDFSGKIIAAALVVNDITQMKYVDKMKTEFVSVASHQLRTPLTAVKLFTEMLMAEQIGKLTANQKQYLSNIYDSTERMVGLVNDLLNVSRIESGRLMVKPEPTDLNKFLSSLIFEAKPLAEIKKVQIKFTPFKRLKKIPLDKGLIRQVYHNLLTNAIRYSKQSGEVLVKIKDEKETVLVSVKDSGIGIPKEVQPRMFEKFFRADNAVKVATEGTGLGLYVSKMIVESAKGSIWFKSSTKRGTTFFVRLPKEGMEEKKGERGLSIS